MDTVKCYQGKAQDLVFVTICERWDWFPGLVSPVGWTPCYLPPKKDLVFVRRIVMHSLSTVLYVELHFQGIAGTLQLQKVSRSSRHLDYNSCYKKKEKKAK